MAEMSSQPQRVAVIDIGSSAFSMVVAEVDAKAEVRYLENLQKPVRFGKDVFTTGRLSNEAIREGIDILKNFKTVIGGYEVKTTQAIATSAVRDAENRDNFIDQVFVRTGIDIEIIEGPEENRLELIAVEYALKDKVDLEKKKALIVEVSSGTTEMIILNQGQFELTRTLSMGSIRLPESATTGKTKVADVQSILKRSIHGVAKNAANEFSLEQIDTFIALGGDMRFAARHIAGESQEKFAVFENKAFSKFMNAVAKLSAEEIVDQYGIPYADAEALYPALLFYANFLSETKAESVIVPMVTIRDGLLIELAQMFSGYKRTDVSRQVVNSARHLGKKYDYSEAHALCVASLSLKLFDLLKEDHGLSSKERLLLEVSAILHDIGMYISVSGHHKHSSYLVDAADIFGIRKADKNIISNVVRYHRRVTPQPTHVSYMSLPRADRAVTSKLAAILRVADSLDRSHQQKIRALTLERTGNAYNLWVEEEVGDISIERDGLLKKGDMFTDVFGAPILLKQGKPLKTG